MYVKCNKLNFEIFKLKVVKFNCTVISNKEISEIKRQAGTGIEVNSKIIDRIGVKTIKNRVIM